MLQSVECLRTLSSNVAKHSAAVTLVISITVVIIAWPGCWCERILLLISVVSVGLGLAVVSIRHTQNCGRAGPSKA